MRSAIVLNGKYRAYEDGNLYRLCDNGTEVRVDGKAMKYFVVSYQNADGKMTQAYVHRVIAKAFVPNPDDKPFVNHIDGNKHNNAADNLEWVTAKENVEHAYWTGTRPSRHFAENRAVYRQKLIERYGTAKMQREAV